MPFQPTTNDTLSLEIFSNLVYGSPTNCPPFMGYTDSINSQNIIFDFYFKVKGPLPQAGCTRTDTVSFANLPIGQYTAIGFWHVVYDEHNGTVLDTGNRYASDTIVFTVSSSTGIQEVSNSTLHIYPNPTKEKLFISLTSMDKIEFLRAIDVNGKEYTLPIQKINKDDWEINVRDLSAGIYILQLNTNKGSYRKKFIKY